MKQPRESNSKPGSSLEVTVIGAGFSGLVSAFYLQRAGYRVRVVEKAKRPGGLISTIERDEGLVETAANGLLNSQKVEELFDEIGVEIHPTLKESRKRFIFWAGRARRWPLNMMGSLRLVWFLILSVFARRWLTPRKFESIRNWGERALGAQATRRLLEPALQGIYAGDPERMSASLILGRFFSSKTKPSTGESRSSKPLRARGTVSAPKGMGELISKLRSHLEGKGVDFIFGQEEALSTIPLQPTVIATSAHQAARVIETLDAKKAQVLAAIELLPITTVTAFFATPVGEGRGFGCLFPPLPPEHPEERPQLGVLMNSYIFSDRSNQGFSETWIFGGAKPSSRILAEASDTVLVDTIEKERVACFKAPQAKIEDLVVTRWPEALPHYTVELERRMPELEERIENVFFIGNYLGNLGLARILEQASLLPQEIETHGQWHSIR